MNAVCECVNGHCFTSRIVADEPDTNYYEVAAACCPECGGEFEVIDEDGDYD